MSEEENKVVEVDEDGVRLPDLANARNMNRNDVASIFYRLNKQTKATIELINSTKCGEQFWDTEDALTKLAHELERGPVYDFGRKNGWLFKKEDREKFLNEEDREGMQYKDRQVLVELYELALETLEFNAEFSRFIKFFNENVLKPAYGIVRYHHNMKEEFNSNEMSKLINAFGEYDIIFRRYNSDSIYKELDVSKEYSFEDNYGAVLDHMDAALVNSNYIGQFLMNTDAVAAYEGNRFSFLDRQTTGGFTYYINAMDNFKKAIEEAERINNSIPKIADGFTQTRMFFYNFTDINKALIDLVTNSRTYVNNYINMGWEADFAPYCIMHYSPAVKLVASTYLGMSLNDPLYYGTKYGEIAHGLIRRCKELAKVVAKNAP